MYHADSQAGKLGLSACFQEVQNLVGEIPLCTGNGTRARGMVVRLWRKPIKESKKVVRL